MFSSTSTNTKEAQSTITSVQLSLSNMLQTSLDIGDTVTAFYTTLQHALNCAGLRYCFSSRKVDVLRGAKAPHCASYNLKTDDNSYGSLEVYRSKPFSETELANLEALLGVFIYPLRNALLYQEAVENSLRDSLTGVGNRAALELTLKRELELAKRTGQPLSVLVLDIDHFKTINDTWGHTFGDEVLHHVAQLISDSLRQTDQVFRFGGEEFIVVLSSTPHAAAMQVANRVRQSIATMAIKNGNEAVPVTASLGVTTTSEGDTRDSLIARGDSALYIAKRMGRNCAVSGGGDVAHGALQAL